ncbi:MAG: hypothetical protein C0618_08565 [Desulfuromonas sp.]|nr:MAG: hypothetical protein C0618_08565 [Desulfuromonas sp.]
MVLRLSLTVALTLMLSTSVFAANLPDTNGKAVIEYLNKTDYQGWQLWPGKTKLYKGTHPHGALLTTYVSSGAYKAIEGKAGGIPNGEFIVKENYTPEKKLAAVTVMYKQQGYSPDGGDWYWLKYAPDGTIDKEGKVDGCIGCHRAVKNNDWLFIGPVK